MYFLVMAGAKPVAIFQDQDSADKFKDFLVSSGVTGSVSTNAVTAGTPDDPNSTCDDYLKINDMVVTETVGILNKD